MDVTESIDDDLAFRISLLKIQDSLSDEDRLRLHFTFGSDIPRRLQSDGSIEASIEALQILMDRSKISKTNSNYLIAVLQGINRQDCALRLRSYEAFLPEKLISHLSASPLSTEIQLSRNTNTSCLADEFEEDSFHLKKNPIETSFACPDPAPIDFDKIDLRPFYDGSCPWTTEFSESLQLKIHPFDYQIEVIRDVIQQGNTIVCLPAGSGKTWISAIITKYYFIKKKQNDPTSSFLAIFFVPRKAIRLQQAQVFVKTGNLKVGICGDDDRIDNMVSKNQIIVSTPQKLVNALKRGTIQMSQIDLIVLDECHNATGGHPYCQIMKYYLCPILDEKNSQNEKTKPIILCLTASISSKDALEKKESSERNLIVICSRLACNTISTVCQEKHFEESNLLTNRSKNDPFEFVKKTQYNEYFLNHKRYFTEMIQNFMKNLEEHELLSKHSIGSSGFITRLVLLKFSMERKGRTNDIVITDYLGFLVKYYDALDDLPFHMIVEQILLNIDQYYKKCQAQIPSNFVCFTYCQEKLKRILEENKTKPAINSKLDNLVLLLQRHLVNKAKGLILVRRTFYAKLLSDFLSNHPNLKNIVKVTWFVGQSSNDFSQTITVQTEILAKFRADEYNVLVATDIIEEGLDVPACSFVIRYEYVSDEIGTIQSRGRARALDSFYYLITDSDSEKHEREQANQCREQEMIEVIKTWPTMDKNTFKRSVLNHREKLISEWENEILREKRERELQKRMGLRKGDVCCRKCNKKIGLIEWLRRRKTVHFIAEPKFLEENQTEVYRENIFQEIVTIGEVKCYCGNVLGGLQKFSDRPDLGLLCALKCKQIKFRIQDICSFIEFSQWSKNNSFDIVEIEEI